MTRSITRFRTLILCLALISFTIGLILTDQLDFPDNLALTLATEAIVIVLYLEFLFSAKMEQNRGWRVTLRIALGFLTIYGPSKILSDCSFSMERDYRNRSPGFHATDKIHCANDRTDDWDEAVLSVFRLFRARCIITLTVAALILIELFIYVRSDEGSTARLRNGATAETWPDDVELASTSMSHSQKVMVSDPLNATV
ncbi:hypothetical protein BGZ70_002624 [Mortierella alpina]|uniref:Uncharacterized protein n=1 Tax=Mortierella alpina TaxID=64518 RepID=A0A9P6JBI6_MORAP|nr:hypothetical protein BGZ70_002624 [Mortierella alpina]